MQRALQANSAMRIARAQLGSTSSRRNARISYMFMRVTPRIHLSVTRSRSQSPASAPTWRVVVVEQHTLLVITTVGTAFQLGVEDFSGDVVPHGDAGVEREAEMEASHDARVLTLSGRGAELLE